MCIPLKVWRNLSIGNSHLTFACLSVRSLRNQCTIRFVLFLLRSSRVLFPDLNYQRPNTLSYLHQCYGIMDGDINILFSSPIILRFTIFTSSEYMVECRSILEYLRPVQCQFIVGAWSHWIGYWCSKWPLSLYRGSTSMQKCILYRVE